MRRRLDFDIVARLDDRALDAAPSIYDDRATRNHLARIAPRGRVSGSHQVMIEAFAGGTIQ
jgi:hypothetical protein